MHIDLVTTVRDEADLLPHFLGYYGSICDRLFVMDDGSTDGSCELVHECPNAILLPFPSTHGFDEIAINTAYRKVIREHSRGVADWVLVPDVDEFIWHPYGLRPMLASEPPGLLKAWRGFHMIHHTFPAESLLRTVRRGFDAGRMWKKPIITSPDLDVRWGKGRHWASGTTRRLAPYTILHYRFLGWDWCTKRTIRNLTRASKSSDKSRIMTVGDNLEHTIAGNLDLLADRFVEGWANAEYLPL